MDNLRSLIIAILRRGQWFTDFKGTAEEWEIHLHGLSDVDLLAEYDAVHEALNDLSLQ